MRKLKKISPVILMFVCGCATSTMRARNEWPAKYPLPAISKLEIDNSKLLLDSGSGLTEDSFSRMKLIAKDPKSSKEIRVTPNPCVSTEELELKNAAWIALSVVTLSFIPYFHNYNCPADIEIRDNVANSSERFVVDVPIQKRFGFFYSVRWFSYESDLKREIQIEVSKKLSEKLNPAN